MPHTVAGSRALSRPHPGASSSSLPAVPTASYLLSHTPTHTPVTPYSSTTQGHFWYGQRWVFSLKCKCILGKVILLLCHFRQVSKSYHMMCFLKLLVFHDVKKVYFVKSFGVPIHTRITVRELKETLKKYQIHSLHAVFTHKNIC